MTIKEFQEKKYVYLTNFLNKENCDQLTLELKKLIDLKKGVKDDQCPLSYAIHGAPVFDKLLEDLIPYFQEASGLKLYPTYSYARLYTEHNEELKLHRDRPSCEISATITLGFEGDVWSIYVADEATEKDGILKITQQGDYAYIKNISKIDMKIGDAVMYKGCEKYHFREPYKEGKWQAQVFLHYVDANGPYAEWKYDKRSALSHHYTPDWLSDFYFVENALSDGFCDKLIEEYSKKEVEKELPYIGLGNDPIKNINLNIRNVLRVPLPLNQGVSATLTSFALNINYQYYKYNITHSNQAEFLMYDINGRYTPHIDMFHDHSDNVRKLTALVFLNDDFEGGRFFIQTGETKIYPPQKKGTIIVFPSYQLHGVEDVTKGKRYSVVAWLAGPYFK